MSNRYMREMKRLSFEINVKEVFAQIAIGATGAPTLSVANSKGVSSVVRNSAGLYTITFGTPASTQAAVVDKYYKLLMVNKAFIEADAPAAPLMRVVANNIQSSGTIQIQFSDAEGVATDPANGEVLLLQFIFGDSNT